MFTFTLGKKGVDYDKASKAFKAVLDYGFGIMNLNKLLAEIREIDIKKSSFFRTTVSRLTPA